MLGLSLTEAASGNQLSEGDTVVLRSKYGSEGKTWWRNVLGDGREASLWLDGAEHVGHAVAIRDGAIRDGAERVTVTVTFPSQQPHP